MKIWNHFNRWYLNTSKKPISKHWKKASRKRRKRKSQELRADQLKTTVVVWQEYGDIRDNQKALGKINADYAVSQMRIIVHDTAGCPRFPRKHVLSKSHLNGAKWLLTNSVALLRLKRLRQLVFVLEGLTNGSWMKGMKPNIPLGLIGLELSGSYGKCLHFWIYVMWKWQLGFGNGKVARKVARKNTKPIKNRIRLTTPLWKKCYR